LEPIEPFTQHEFVAYSDVLHASVIVGMSKVKVTSVDKLREDLAESHQEGLPGMAFRIE
jgi:hypothetical protein